MIDNYSNQIQKDMVIKLDIVNNNIKKIQVQKNYIEKIYKILDNIKKESSHLGISNDNISIIIKSIEKD